MFDKIYDILRAKIISEIPVIDSEIGIQIKQPIQFSDGKALLEIPKLMNIEIGFINLLSFFPKVTDEIIWARENFVL
jgi:hypothetical protein